MAVRVGSLRSIQLRQALDELRDDRGAFIGVGYWRNVWHRLQRAAAIGFVGLRRIRMAVENLADPGRAGAGHPKRKISEHFMLAIMTVSC